MTKNQKTEELKKILIVGSGGRENSIAWALSKNQSIEKIYVCPGNGGTANFEKCICLKPKAEDARTIIEESLLLGINLVFIGPEVLVSDPQQDVAQLPERFGQEVAGVQVDHTLAFPAVSSKLASDLILQAGLAAPG